VTRIFRIIILNMLLRLLVELEITNHLGPSNADVTHSKQDQKLDKLNITISLNQLYPGHLSPFSIWQGLSYRIQHTIPNYQYNLIEKRPINFLNSGGLLY
jgi:hypothetical protein